MRGFFGKSHLPNVYMGTYCNGFLRKANITDITVWH
jgi:hypothetical protein